MTNSISRKDFLKASGALALSLPFLSRTAALAKPLSSVGLQLYTLRNEVSKDLAGTLKSVAEIGYKELELFGYNNGTYFGKTPKELRSMLDGLGLKAPSGHFLVPQMQKDWDKAIDHAKELGQSYMVCAYLFPQERTKLDDYKRYVDLFNKSAEACKKAGIQFAYHNHDFEFQPLEGQVPYDLLLKGTDPNLVKMELDLYWATFAGKDPVAMFKENPGRFPMVHLKDIAKTEKREFAEVGTGSINFQRIMDARKTAGIKHFFVEQDVVSKGTPLEAIAISFANVKKLSV
ncbi:xylose isomerase domain protein TIM barrel [Fibrella aestuarina BUZ 2]|uniref:Xylose isomerase domain protein TIM barrel n=1 Tax=Fibrella aestuarina BUZ 2 TaxID=1166018 RepID=I0K984_9BACT|nr:sugar phosphate isomerase/epimerase [Fibrella aestuarina]CCH00687.1 xylose isomerase domain protein TIM barrel [Fibrella aestuarina BUZ 2]